jgi:hypothetical protein
MHAVLALPYGAHPERREAVSRPTPDERLRERLATLPDGCRALLEAIERQQVRGGGEVIARFVVRPDGELLLGIEVLYGRRIESCGGAT